MRWFRRESAEDRIRKEDPELAELLSKIETLDDGSAAHVESAVADLGLGVTEESSVVIATVITTAMQAGLDEARTRAQRAAHVAMRKSPAGGAFPRTVYAAGVLAEAFAIRRHVDIETWTYITHAWRGVLALPEHGQKEVGSNDANARDTRRWFDAEYTLPSRIAGSPAGPPWVAEFMDEANDDRFLVAIAEGGITGGRARALLSLLRDEVARRLRTDTPVAKIVPRKLVDIAATCREEAPGEWDLAIRQILDSGEEAADVLNRLMQGTYEEAKPRLWAYLHREALTSPPGTELAFIQQEVLPGVHAQLVLHSGESRWRPVILEMLESWSVSVEQAWADAIENIARSPVQEDTWPDDGSPVRIVRVPGMESEWLGLLAHRRPDAPPTGHIVAMPFRGSALILGTDALGDARVIPAFAHLARGAFEQASRFEDQLCSQLLWVRSDGTRTVLCELTEPPETLDDLPPEFLTAMSRYYRPGGDA